MATVEAIGEQRDLRRALHVRHIVMLAVGGTIASGFMLASGATISLAGPAVIIPYFVAGIVSVAVCLCVAELSLQKFSAGAFAVYAQETMGHLMGFLTGWMYWLAWTAGAAGEAVAIGTYITAEVSPLHRYPVWLVAAVILLADLIINMIGVLLMGNYEFFMSTFKLIGLGILVLVVLGAVIGIGHSPALGTSVIHHHGGFFPTGISGIFTCFLLVFFAYTGVEMCGVAAEESVNPERDVPRSLILTGVLVAITFVLSSVALVLVVPYQAAGTTSSPVVDVMNRLHNTPLVVLMTLVVIAGSVSALDGCVYGASRMMFALGREGYFPAAIARSHPSRKVPTLAILLTGLCMFLGIMLDVVSPNYAYVFLGSLGTIGFMWTWAMIPLSLILYRVKMGAERVAALRFKVPLYPITPVFVIAAVLLAIIAPIFQNSPGLFGLNGGEVPVVAGAIWVAVWIIYFLTIGRHFQHGHEYRAQQAAAQQAVAAGARPSSQ